MPGLCYNSRCLCPDNSFQIGSGQECRCGGGFQWNGATCDLVRKKVTEECENDVRKSMTMIMEDVNRFADGLPAEDDQAILVFMVE